MTLTVESSLGSREQVAAEVWAAAFGDRRWPDAVRCDEDLHLLSLTFDTLDQFAAWANHLGAKRDRPIIGSRLVHGARATVLGWDVALWTYTLLCPADIDQLVKQVAS